MICEAVKNEAQYTRIHQEAMSQTRQHLTTKALWDLWCKKMAMGHVFLRIRRCYSIGIIPPMSHTHSSTTDAIILKIDIFLKEQDAPSQSVKFNKKKAKKKDLIRYNRLFN